MRNRVEAKTPTISRETLVADLRRLGIRDGDTLLVRATLGAVGRIQGGREAFVGALLEAVGSEGTISSLAFTASKFIGRPDARHVFHAGAKTNSGALPQAMLDHPDARRSKHPTCSFVAIGKHSGTITREHGPTSPAYEPVRKVMQLNGKGLLIGCVRDSPGFTSAHVAEHDLGLYHRIICPWLNSAYFLDDTGTLRLFRRRDLGLCSMGFVKFYSYYVEAGILACGRVGNAYTILVPLLEAYQIEYALLAANPQFSVCDNPKCILCNGRRWDRLHRLPALLLRRMAEQMRAKLRTCWRRR
jgi:aminoglycoside N3'-acetyltransferase